MTDKLSQALATLMVAVGERKFSHAEWNDLQEGFGLLVASQRRIRRLEQRVKQLETEQRALNAEVDAPRLRAVE